METLIVTGVVCGFIGFAIGLAIGLSIGGVGDGISSNWPVAKPTPQTRRSKLKLKQSSIPNISRTIW